ncbi:hypothetical protein Emed_005201 [Eimeria media]
MTAFVAQSPRPRTRLRCCCSDVRTPQQQPRRQASRRQPVYAHLGSAHALVELRPIDQQRYQQQTCQQQAHNATGLAAAATAAAGTAADAAAGDATSRSEDKGGMGGSYQQQQQLHQLLRFFDLPPSCRCVRSVRMRYLLLAKQRHPDQQPAAAAAAAAADFALLQYNYEQLRSMLAEETAATTANAQQQQQQQRQQWQQQQRQSWQQHPNATSSEQWWYQQRHEQRQHWKQQWQDYQQQQQQHWQQQQQQQQRWQQQQQQKWQQQQRHRASFTPFPAALRGAGLAFGFTVAYWLTHTGPSHRSLRTNSNDSSNSSSLPEDSWYLQHDKQHQHHHQQQQQLHQERLGDHYEPASLARHRMLAHSRREQMLRHMQMSQRRRERHLGSRSPKPSPGARRLRSSERSSSNSSRKRQQATPQAAAGQAAAGMGAAAAVVAAEGRSGSNGDSYDTPNDSNQSSSSSGSINVPREPQAWRDEFVRVARLLQGQPDSNSPRVSGGSSSSSSSTRDTSHDGLVLQWERSQQHGMVPSPLEHDSSSSAIRPASAAADLADAAEADRHFDKFEAAPPPPSFMLEIPESATPTALLTGPAATARAPAAAATAAAGQPHPRSKSAGNLAERDEFYAKRYLHRAVRVMRRRGAGEQQGLSRQRQHQPQHGQQQRWPTSPEDALLQQQLAQQQLLLHENRVEAPVAL